jgi:gliding motility-associated-like protein
MISTVFSCLLFLGFESYAHDELHRHKGFIKNCGQWDAQVNYKIPVQNGALFLVDDGFMYSFYDGAAVSAHHAKPYAERIAGPPPPELINFHAVSMKLIGATPVQNPAASDPGTTQYNYYIGKNKSQWASGLYEYHSVNYEGIYAGINMKVYTHESGMKYDFIVKPEAQVGTIKMKYTGADAVTLKNNTLTIKTSLGTITEQNPYAYQVIAGEKRTVSCSFKQFDDGSIGFETGAYDHTQELIIDPLLIFATYSGSTDDNWGYSATYDSGGNGYSGGIVFGSNFPATTGAFQVPYGGGQLDIGILKYNPAGTNALWISYIGGSGVEFPQSMIVNEYDELIVFGSTSSADFPVTSGAYSTVFSGGNAVSFENNFIQITNGLDIFITRISPNGQQMLASTYVGGSGNDGFNTATELVANYADEIRGSLWVDADNNIYVGTSTQSANFPVSSGVFQPTFGGGDQDGVILKMNGNLSSLKWATFLGGNQNDGIYYLTVDHDQNVIVTGGTISPNFPVTAGAWDQTFGANNNTDGFVSKLDSSGQQLIASSYIGTPEADQSYIVGNDRTNHIYLFGQTSATSNYFTINSAISVPAGNQFLLKLAPDLSAPVWSSTFGNATGSPDISPTALLVDVCDKIYATGWGGVINSFGTTTFGLPVTADAFQSSTDGNDFYLYVIDNQAQQLEYASFLGGTGSLDHVDGGTSRFDRKGVVYQSICAGCGARSDLPVTPGAYSPTNNSSNCNNALVKFDFETPITISAFVNVDNPVGCAPYTVNFQNTSVNATVFKWILDSTIISSTQNLTYEFETGGTYEITLIATDSSTCNVSDTVSVTITVLSSIEASLPELSACPGTTITLGPEGYNDPYYTFQWSPAQNLDDPTGRRPVLTFDTSITYQLILSIGSCADTLLQRINESGGIVDTLDAINACIFDTVQLGPSEPLGPTTTYTWIPSTGLSNPTIYNPTAIVNQSLDYLLIAQRQVGCVDSFYYSVVAGIDQINPAPDVTTCTNIPVQIGTPGDSVAYAYAWSPTSGLSNAAIANPIATVSQTTTFRLLRVPVGITPGCPGFDTVSVNLVEPPVASFQYNFSPNCDGLSAEFQDSSQGYLSLNWQFGTGQTSSETNPVIVFPYKDTLFAMVVAINGACTDTAIFEQYIGSIYDYYQENKTNVFSPNGDLINDCFSPALQLEPAPQDKAFLPCTDLVVYNRWGELLFDSVADGVESCWDGKTRNGVALPEGVYFYRYIIDGKERAGIVHLKIEQ